MVGCGYTKIPYCMIELITLWTAKQVVYMVVPSLNLRNVNGRD
jgi:hypothetical protein